MPISDDTWDAMFAAAKARSNYKKRYSDNAKKQADYLNKKGKLAGTMGAVTAGIGALGKLGNSDTGDGTDWFGAAF